MMTQKKYPLPPGFLVGVCGCTCMIKGRAIEDRLRAHVAQEHGEVARRDEHGEIVIARSQDFREAWLLVNDGYPVIIQAPEAVAS